MLKMKNMILVLILLLIAGCQKKLVDENGKRSAEGWYDPDTKLVDVNKLLAHVDKEAKEHPQAPVSKDQDLREKLGIHLWLKYRNEGYDDIFAEAKGNEGKTLVVMDKSFHYGATRRGFVYEFNKSDDRSLYCSAGFTSMELREGMDPSKGNSDTFEICK